MTAPSRSVLADAGVWCLAVALVSVLVVLTGYRTRDPDSRAYTRIATRLAAEPVERWIAPQWWGAWGLQGLFREHPAGILLGPALLVRAGVPADQAPYVVTFAAQAGCLLLFVALAARVVPAADARLLAWALVLLPIAFVFRVRANQEYPLLLGLLLVVYGIARSAAGPPWLALALAGYVWALLVKGIFALLAPIYAVIWLLFVPAPPGGIRRWTPWIGVAALVAVTPVAALMYERSYVAATGQSFLDYYLGPRISLEGATPAEALPAPVAKAYNALWYVGRVLWYAAPWSIALLLARRTALPGARLLRVAGLAVIATLALVALRDTKADRYVFPAYFLAGVGGVIAALSWSPGLAAFARRLDATWPWGPALLWVLLVAGRVMLG